MGTTNFSPGGRAWVELNLQNLRHNVNALTKLLPPGCRLMPAVKANAYGHGAGIITKELQRIGVCAFCVATAEEGADLRRQGIVGEILILGYTHPEDLPLLVFYELTQTVVDLEYAQMLERFPQPLHVHLAIDTGMHRLGIPSTDTESLLQVFRAKNLRVDGVFTHLCAGDADTPESRTYTQQQARSFSQAVTQLRAHGYTAFKTHILNSFGLLFHSELGGHYARVGLALYGAYTAPGILSSGMDLRPVLSLRARVASVRVLCAGETAGYGCAFTAGRETRLAILTIGYADGIPRTLSCSVGEVLLHGQTAKVAGRICMDQMLIDVTDVPDVHPGDIATLIGSDGKHSISAGELAARTGSIPNEILSRLGPRLNRIVLE